MKKYKVFRTKTQNYIVVMDDADWEIDERLISDHSNKKEAFAVAKVHARFEDREFVDWTGMQ